jgi:hypothetical protein
MFPPRNLTTLAFTEGSDDFGFYRRGVVTDVIVAGVMKPDVRFPVGGKNRRNRQNNLIKSGSSLDLQLPVVIMSSGRFSATIQSYRLDILFGRTGVRKRRQESQAG